MISFIKNVLQSFLDEDEETAGETPESEGAERRADFRFRLGGFDIDVRGGSSVSTMQLKDLSCTGGAGITDLAIPVGGTIFLLLPSGQARAAEVRWARTTAMGFRFVRPLEIEMVLFLYGRRWSQIPALAGEASERGLPPDAANAA